MKSGLDTRAYLEGIRKIIVFKSFSEKELKGVLEFCDIVSFDEDEKIVFEGDISHSFFAVIEGTVKVSVNQEGKEVYICSLGEGEIFGEAAMFLKVKRTADVSAVGSVILLRFDRRGVFDFLRAYPGAGNKFLMLLIYSLLRKLRDANKELAFERRSDINQDDVDSLIAEFSQK